METFEIKTLAEIKKAKLDGQAVPVPATEDESEEEAGEIVDTGDNNSSMNSKGEISSHPSVLSPSPLHHRPSSRISRERNRRRPLSEESDTHTRVPISRPRYSGLSPNVGVGVGGDRYVGTDEGLRHRSREQDRDRERDRNRDRDRDRDRGAARDARDARGGYRERGGGRERDRDRAQSRGGGRINDRIGDKISDRMVDKISDRMGDKISDRTGDKIGDRLGDRIGDRVGEKGVGKGEDPSGKGGARGVRSRSGDAPRKRDGEKDRQGSREGRPAGIDSSGRDDVGRDRGMGRPTERVSVVSASRQASVVTSDSKGTRVTQTCVVEQHQLYERLERPTERPLDSVEKGGLRLGPESGSRYSSDNERSRSRENDREKLRKSGSKDLIGKSEEGKRKINTEGPNTDADTRTSTDTQAHANKRRKLENGHTATDTNVVVVSPTPTNSAIGSVNASPAGDRDDGAETTGEKRTSAGEIITSAGELTASAGSKWEDDEFDGNTTKSTAVTQVAASAVEVGKTGEVAVTVVMETTETTEAAEVPSRPKWADSGDEDNGGNPETISDIKMVGEPANQMEESSRSKWEDDTDIPAARLEDVKQATINLLSANANSARSSTRGSPNLDARSEKNPSPKPILVNISAPPSMRQPNATPAYVPNATNDMDDDDDDTDDEDMSETYYPALRGCRSVGEYTYEHKISEGMYGVVFKATDKLTGTTFALKKLKMDKEKEGFPITSLREINTLLKSAHPNVVKVVEIVVGKSMDMIYICMEYIDNDVQRLMSDMTEPFSEAEVKSLSVQLLRATHHMHSNWILHRDLKTSNLLITNTGRLVVGDFGLAREYGDPLKAYTQLVVTLWYRPPELLLGAKKYSAEVDMWSVGCIIAEFILGNALFMGTSEIDQLSKIYALLGTPNAQIWPGWLELPNTSKCKFDPQPYNLLKEKVFPISEAGFDLINGLLTYNPQSRMTAKDALTSDYFEEFPYPIKAFKPLDRVNPQKAKRNTRVKSPPAPNPNDPLQDEATKPDFPMEQYGSFAKK